MFLDFLFFSSNCSTFSFVVNMFPPLLYWGFSVSLLSRLYWMWCFTTWDEIFFLPSTWYLGKKEKRKKRTPDTMPCPFLSVDVVYSDAMHFLWLFGEKSYLIDVEKCWNLLDYMFSTGIKKENTPFLQVQIIASLFYFYKYTVNHLDYGQRPILNPSTWVTPCRKSQKPHQFN